MYLPLKPVCIRPRKDGPSLIHLQYCYNNEQKTLLDTRISIPIDCWDKKNLCITQNLPPSFGDSKKLNKSLQEQIRLAENVIAFARQKGVKEIGIFTKEYYSPGLDIFNLSDLVKKCEQEKKQKQNQKISSFENLSRSKNKNFFAFIL